MVPVRTKNSESPALQPDLGIGFRPIPTSPNPGDSDGKAESHPMPRFNRTHDVKPWHLGGPHGARSAREDPGM